MTYPRKYSVIAENYEGSAMAMEYLYSLGHRKIAYISVPLDSLAAPERYQAYKDFLAAKGLPYDPSLVVEAAEYSAPAGYDAASKLLATARGRFTAVFASWDDIAISSITLFRASGLRVPEDISVIGFDDLAHSEMADLTTIRQNREKIGTLAADILISQMQALPTEHPYDTRVPTSLVLRATCSGPSN
jgi:DNA-binding LacI/PurR family transcriptional regulator